MARPKKEAAPAVTTITATVNSAPGLNLRKHPARNAPVVRILADKEQITLDSSIDTPGGWLAVAGGGFVMKQYVTLAQ